MDAIISGKGSRRLSTEQRTHHNNKRDPPTIVSYELNARISENTTSRMWLHFEELLDLQEQTE